MAEPTPDTVPEGADPLREQLLEAAARVFAAKGYSGTKVMDIVKEAGLSAGAMYSRFSSKNDLLTEAVVTRAVPANTERVREGRVADLIMGIADRHRHPLSDVEAMHLEAYVTARREPDVATAIYEVLRRRRAALEPLVQQARADGTLGEGRDAEPVLYLLDTLRLGLLLQRAAGVSPPDNDAWEDLLRMVVDSFTTPAE